MDAAAVMNLLNATNMGALANSQIGPAVFAALLGLTQSLQAVQAVPGLGLATPEQDISITSLQNKLNHTSTQLRDIQDSLNPIVSECGKNVIDKLEMAMTKLYKLAVFIRGDYDDREPDTVQRDELLKQAVQAFKEVEDCAEAGLKKVGQLHAQVMEIENTVINPAKQEVELLLENNRNELSSLQDQIINSEHSVNTLEQSVRMQSQAVSQLNDKISAGRDAKLASDITFTILTIGIGNLINDGPLDPFNLQSSLDSATRLLENAQRDYNRAATDLNNLRLKRMTLESRLSAARQTSTLIPSVSSLASATNTNCIMLQRQFGPLKERSAQLLLAVGKIQSDATVTQALAYSKKEFALGLLEICRDSLIDQALIDEAAMVKDEVIKEYGAGEAPEEVTEMATETEERMGMIGAVLSIRG